MDVQQVLPLPEASDYTVKVREKAREERRKQRTGRDLTKFDVTIEGSTETRLPKRRAIFLIVKHACDQGISPEEVSKAPCEDSENSDWYYAQFKKTATQAKMQGKFDKCINCHGQASDRDYVFGLPN